MNDKRHHIFTIAACLVVAIIPTLQAAQLYYTDIVDHSGTAAVIKRVNADGSEVTTLLTGLKHPRGITLDISGGKLYWNEDGVPGIRRANLDGTGPIESLVATSGSENGLALDLVAGKLYWPGGILDPRIMRANLDGSGGEILVADDRSFNPSGIALDTMKGKGHGKIYWTDLEGNYDGTGSIWRSNLDGSNPQRIVDGVDESNGIVCDAKGGKIYWTELVSGKIQRANLDGSGIEDLVVGLDTPASITLDLNAKKVYWTDSEWFVQVNRIERCNFDGSNIETVVIDNFPFGIAVDAQVPVKGHGKNK